MSSINTEAFKRVQKEINKYLEKNPQPDISEEYPEIDENELYLDIIDR